MLSPADNELLTRSGPGTPMGEFVRRFWVPFLLSRELMEPDGPPRRVSLLGEKLVAFRDSAGRVGLLDEHCPHRLASLFFGRNEECGLRCIYHGWKFDVTGACVDLPSEPAASPLQRKVRIKSYPVREMGGVLWTFMGPEGAAGEIPAFECLGVPESHRFVSQWMQECNNIQAIEGEIDSAHVSFLHRRFDKQNAPKTSIVGEYFRADTAPSWRVDPTPYGFVAAARRGVDGQAYWRMNQFLFPFYTMIAPSHVGGTMTTRMWVPRDDESCWVICFTYCPDRPLTEQEVANFRAGETSHPVLIPGTMRQRANRDNDYLIDRTLQRTTFYSGIAGVRAQDTAMTESMGHIVDRSREHLGTSDIAIIAMRKAMLAAARKLAAGEAPVAARGGPLYAVRSWSAMLPADLAYNEDPAIIRAMRTAPAEASAAE
jgi:phthalate 4,5-dioxygenase